MGAALLTAEERAVVFDALQRPRGRYTARRASQLSGVPERTVYEWATRNILVPDFGRARPKQWSYRDLVYLRLLAWLRSRNMVRQEAARRVKWVRSQVMAGDLAPDTDVGTVLSTDGRVMLLDGEDYDHVSGQQLLGGLEKLVTRFDLLSPVDELGSTPLWGPNLVHPSPRTFISPSVLAGEPCVTDTRIPTGSLLALSRDRGLDPSAITQLYPGLEEADVLDAISLETKLRRAA